MTPEWYPAGSEACITLEIYQEQSAVRFEESVVPSGMGQLNYGVRFHEGDRNPGHDLASEVVAALRADSRGSLRHCQRIEPDRLDAAVQRTFQ
jgi:hypothetical protein